VIHDGVSTTGNVIVQTPGAFVTGVRAVGSVPGAVFNGFARPVGK
jgi:hypothetical protein